jgi:hypothetical protein
MMAVVGMMISVKRPYHPIGERKLHTGYQQRNDGKIRQYAETGF